MVGLLRYGGIAGVMVAGQQVTALQHSERIEDKCLVARVIDGDRSLEPSHRFGGPIQEIQEPPGPDHHATGPSRRAGCGGCDWLHVEPDAAPGLEAAIVSDALGRVDGLDDVAVDVETVSGPPAMAYRTTVRVAVDSSETPAELRGRADVVIDGTGAVEELLRDLLRVCR